MTRILAFDLETTGLNTQEDRVVEFCFLSCNEQLDIQQTWRERVNPGIAIPREASDVHGISDKDVEALPRLATFAGRIQDLVAGAVLVAHNAAFDAELLHNELVRHGQQGLPIDQPLVDTYELEKRLHPNTLAATYERYAGRALQGAHGAETDAAAVVDILRGQLRRHASRLPGGLPAIVQGAVRAWVDRSRRFYKDQSGTVRFAFGRFKDEPAEKHLDYLQWMMEAEFPEEAKVVAGRLLRRSI